MNIHGLYLLIMKHVSSPGCVKWANWIAAELHATLLFAQLLLSAQLIAELVYFHWANSKQQAQWWTFACAMDLQLFRWKKSLPSIFKSLGRRNAAGESFIASLSFESSQIFLHGIWVQRKKEWMKPSDRWPVIGLARSTCCYESVTKLYGLPLIAQHNSSWRHFSRNLFLYNVIMIQRLSIALRTEKRTKFNFARQWRNVSWAREADEQ